MRARLIFVIFIATGLLSGCGTMNSYVDGCAGTYSGVKTDLEYIGAYHEVRDSWDFATVGVDVLLSSLIDTTALPVTTFLAPRADNTLGCYWAGPGKSDEPDSMSDPTGYQP